MKPKTLQINVTEEDIRNGVYFTKCNCPIARAVIREARSTLGCSFMNWASIDHDKGRIHISNLKAWQFKLSESARDFIANRDAGKSVKPFTFEIEATLCHLKQCA